MFVLQQLVDVWLDYNVSCWKLGFPSKTEAESNSAITASMVLALRKDVLRSADCLIYVPEPSLKTKHCFSLKSVVTLVSVKSNCLLYK